MGEVHGIDVDRDARITALLAADSNMRYNRENRKVLQGRYDKYGLDSRKNDSHGNHLEWNQWSVGDGALCQ